MVTQNLTHKKYVYTADYWKNLGVSYEAIKELADGKQKSYLRSFIRYMKLPELKELTIQLDITITDNELVEDIIKKLLKISDCNRLMLLLLNDFLKRKKKTVSLFYSKIQQENYQSTLAKLLKIFKDNPQHLLSILTYHYWLSRASGQVYHLDQNINAAKARKLLTESEYTERLGKLLKTHSQSESNYRLFSHAIIQDTLFIGLLYKEVNDISVPDYDDALRNKQIDTRLFAIDISDGKIELKTKTISEYKAIKKFIEENCACNILPITNEVFNSYDKTKTIKSMLSDKSATDTLVDDFLIDKIIFSTSTLKNSPEITLQTKNNNVWPAVEDAHDKRTIDIKSLKDLKSLSFKSMDIRRTIYSTVKDNGNIIFTMNDARMDDDILKAIRQKFKNKFGLPLFQEISNRQFKDGEIDILDYVLGHSNSLDQDPHIQKVHDELLKENLLEKKNITYAYCNDNSCPYQGHEHNINNTELECPICFEDIYTDDVESTDVNMNNVQRYVKDKIKTWCTDFDWKMHSNSQLTYGNDILELIKVSNKQENKVLQFYIADKTINRNLLEKLTIMMDPIVVIFVGQREDLIEAYSENCIEATTFGRLHSQKEREMNNFIESLTRDLALRTKNTISVAATKSYVSMKKKIKDTPSEITKDQYTSADLEDDGFNLIKDLFMNAVKWGKEKSGKPVPEGLFSISFDKKGKHKESYAFSFDFKLTRNNAGYDLGKDEQRKAADYVNDLNESDEIRNFAHSKELTGHILISNRFKDTQKENIKEHFEKYIVDDHKSKPILMTTDTLMYLHSKYREHFKEIENKKMYFYEQLYKTLINETNLITNNDIDELISKVLNRRWRDIESVDTDRLTEELRV